MDDLLQRLTFIFFLIAFVLFIIGFSTPWWTLVNYDSDTEISAGLWQECQRVGTVKWKCTGLSDSGELLFKTARTMMCLAIVTNTCSFAFFITWLLRKERCCGISALISCATASLPNVIGVSIYAAANTGNYMGWSFALACCSSIVLFLNGNVGLLFLLCMDCENAYISF